MEFLNSDIFIFVFPDKDKRSIQRPYPMLSNDLEEKGVELFFIDLNWDKHSSLAECSLEATKKIQELIREFNPPKTYFVGIGVGAMLAAHMAFMFRGDAMLLCSMKPFFQNELAFIPWAWRFHAKRHIYRSKPKPNYPAKRIELPTIFLQGEKEKYYFNEEIMRMRKECFVNAEVVIIPKTGAKLKRKAYLSALKEEILKMAGIEDSTPAIK